MVLGLEDWPFFAGLVTVFAATLFMVLCAVRVLRNALETARTEDDSVLRARARVGAWGLGAFAIGLLVFVPAALVGGFVWPIPLTLCERRLVVLGHGTDRSYRRTLALLMIASGLVFSVASGYLVAQMTSQIASAPSGDVPQIAYALNASFAVLAVQGILLMAAGAMLALLWNAPAVSRGGSEVVSPSTNMTL